MPRPSFTGARWIPLEPDADALTRLRGTDLSEVVARCVALRFGAEATEVAPPSLDHLEDPFAMAGMAAATDRLHRAARDGERVRIITDYDVDGTTSSLILQAALGLVGEATIDYHIPSRFGEGYGFSVAAADAAADAGVDLVVTADIGVRDHAAVARARERGVEVIVCDHHLPAGTAVPADALVLCPPQAACSYPNPHLAACGIGLKVAQALLDDHPRRDGVIRSLLKLAAIGTVADLVPLTTRENRAIVALGLDELNRGRHHPGLQALLDNCDLKPGAIGEGDLGFRIGPRINAAGRMADAQLVVRMLTTRDPAEARGLAADLERHNQERRRVQERLVKEALAQAGDDPRDFVVVAGPEEAGWHRGVVGIVASRLKDELHRPVAVVSLQGDRAVGSVRSVPGVHAVEALESCADLLLKFGGHPAAAGFSLPADGIEALGARLHAWMAGRALDLSPVRKVDAEVPAEALGRDLHDALGSLGPFGMGNPRPRLLIPGIRPQEVRLLGAAQRMVKFLIPRPGGRPVEAIWWDKAEHRDDLASQAIDLLGTLDLNRWRGRETVQIRVTDARRAAP